MSRISFLRDQIERAKRFAASVTNTRERERFLSMAEEYQREIDALSSSDAKSADTSASSDAIAAPSEPDKAAPSNAIAATNGGDAIASEDAGQQETD
jgi:hypothetical protein